MLVQRKRGSVDDWYLPWSTSWSRGDVQVEGSGNVCDNTFEVVVDDQSHTLV